MNLAYRYTGRSKMIGFNKSYHGSTQVALFLIGDEYWSRAYRPLVLVGTAKRRHCWLSDPENRPEAGAGARP